LDLKNKRGNNKLENKKEKKIKEDLFKLRGHFNREVNKSAICGEKKLIS